MGVGFTYFTTDSVDDFARRTILAEASAITREWSTTESIVFFSMPGFESQLYGASKIIPEALAEEVSAQGISDSRFIIERLSEWSSRFHLTWQIEIEGSPVGIVKNGSPDRGVLGMVERIESRDRWQF